MLQLTQGQKNIDRSLYIVFELSDFSNISDVKKAYKKMVRKYHPEKNKEDGAADWFQAINDVKEILCDEEEKKEYDEELRWYGSEEGSGVYFEALKALPDFYNFFWHMRYTDGYSQKNLFALSKSNVFCEKMAKESDWVIKALNLNLLSIKELVECAASSSFTFNSDVFFFLRGNSQKTLRDVINIREKFSGDFLNEFDNQCAISVRYDDLFSIPEHAIPLIETPVGIKAVFKDLGPSPVIRFADSLSLIFDEKCYSLITQSPIKLDLDSLTSFSTEELTSILGPYGLQAIENDLIRYSNYSRGANRSCPNVPTSYFPSLFTPNGLDFLERCKQDLLLQIFFEVAAPNWTREEFAHLMSSPVYDGIKDYIGGLLNRDSAERKFILLPECINALKEGELSINDLTALRNTPEKKLKLIFSSVCLQEIKNKTFDLSFLKQLSSDALSILLTPERLDAFKMKQMYAHEVSALSPQGLARILTPTYIEALRKLSVRFELSPEEQNSPVACNKLRWINFDRHLKSIEMKANKLKSHEQAGPVARQLYQDLLDARARFIDSGDPVNAEKQFILDCNKAIATARPELEKHRGWAKILADIANALLLLTSLGMSYVVTGRFSIFSPKTDSAKCLNYLENTVKRLGS